MAEPPPDALTLTTLPADIIRGVIGIDDGENMDNMKLISPLWHALVSEYTAKLPHVADIIIADYRDSPNKLRVEVIVEKQHVKYFKRILPKSLIMVKPPNDTMVRMRFELLTTESDLLKRLFQSTNYVKAVYTRRRGLEVVQSVAGNVKIDSMHITSFSCDMHLQNMIMRMIQRHPIVNIGLNAEEYEQELLCDYLSRVSASGASVAYVKELENCGIVSQDPIFWDSLAKDIVDNNEHLTLMIFLKKCLISKRFHPSLTLLRDFYYYFDEYFFVALI